VTSVDAKGTTPEAINDSRSEEFISERREQMLASNVCGRKCPSLIPSCASKNNRKF